MQQRAVGRVAARAPAAEQPDPDVARRIAGGAIGMARAVLDFDQHLAARQRAVRADLVVPYLPVESVDRIEKTAVGAHSRAVGDRKRTRLTSSHYCAYRMAASS